MITATIILLWGALDLLTALLRFIPNPPTWELKTDIGAICRWAAAAQLLGACILGVAYVNGG